MFVGRVFRRVVGDAHEAFMQHPIGLMLRHAVAHHQRIGIKHGLGAGLVRHAVGDGEHVLIVDRDRPREDQTLAVVPGRASRDCRGPETLPLSSFHGVWSLGRATLRSVAVQPNSAK